MQEEQAKVVASARALDDARAAADGSHADVLAKLQQREGEHAAAMAAAEEEHKKHVVEQDAAKAELEGRIAALEQQALQEAEEQRARSEAASGA